MAAVVLDERFLASAYMLPKEIGRKVFKALHLYSRDPNHPSLHREKLAGKAEGLLSIRVDDDYRIIFREVGAAPVLMEVAKHDVAYRSADSLLATVPAEEDSAVHFYAPRALPRVRLQIPPYGSPTVELDDVAQLVRTKKYMPLAQALLNSRTRRVSLSFAEITEILGERLPPSAMKYRAWWANDLGRHVQAAAWLGVGWTVAGVDLETKQVVFALRRDQAERGGV